MPNRRKWFAILVAVCVAALFIIPGIALGDKGPGTTDPPPDNPPCDADHGHPAEHAKRCDGGTTTDGTTTDGTTTDGTTTDGTTTDGTTTDGTTTDGTTTDGTTTDGTTTDGVTNQCVPDTIAIVDGNEIIRLHLEPGGGAGHSDGVLGIVHLCLTVGAPPAPPPAAPCPGSEDAVPGVLAIRGDAEQQVLHVCAHV